jgi:hypothetical protein
MRIRPILVVAPGIALIILLSVALLTLLLHIPVAKAQSKTMQGIFQRIQQRAKADPHFIFTVESYAPASTTNQAVGVIAINAAANSIVDLGDDYVCLGSIQVTNDPKDLKTVCLPDSSIVRVYAQNTLFQ